MIFNWGMPYIVGKDFFYGYKILFFDSPKKNWFKEDMNIQNFRTKKVIFASLGIFFHLDVASMKSHRIYYREGSGALTQRLQTM
jgi:hypothetical protein